MFIYSNWAADQRNMIESLRHGGYPASGWTWLLTTATQYIGEPCKRSNQSPKPISIAKNSFEQFTNVHNTMLLPFRWFLTLCCNQSGYSKNRFTNPTQIWTCPSPFWGGFPIKRYGDGSKPWYLVNPKIAGKWMFIPLKMVCIGIDPYPYIKYIYSSHGIHGSASSLSLGSAGRAGWGFGAGGFAVGAGARLALACLSKQIIPQIEVVVPVVTGVITHLYIYIYLIIYL